MLAPFRRLRPIPPLRSNALALGWIAVALLGPLAGCAPEDAPEPGEPTLAPTPLPEGPFDLLLHGGTLVDGSGAPPREVDLLVRDGRIVYIGPVEPDEVEATERFDATGLVVAPGFIDAHSHGDPVGSPGFHNFLAMGVTTITLGQDGGGPEAGTLAAYMEAVDAAGPGVNVAFLTGHNTLRREAGVGYAAATEAGTERMVRLVEAALDAGAFGLSTGLEYDGGAQSSLDELAALAAPVAARDGVVMSHMRNEDADRVEASLEELIEQGRRTGARVHASHLKVVLGSDPAQAERILARMAEVRGEGIRMTADVYPYTASFTGISILFPDWARPPNDYEAVAAARRDELLDHLRARVESRNGPEATLFGSGELSGRTLAEVAEGLDRPFEEILLALGPGGARAAYFVMDEGMLDIFLGDPHVAISSDGSPTMAHPRGYGSFPRVIRRYVVEEGRLSLEEAVRKMTGLTASILGLDDRERVELPRGRLVEGWAADLVAFSPAELTDRADYTAPHRLAEGMRGVWIGGERVWEEGAAVPGPRRGRVLRDGGREGAER